jgi:hypothetical protein
MERPAESGDRLQNTANSTVCVCVCVCVCMCVCSSIYQRCVTQPIGANVMVTDAPHQSLCTVHVSAVRSLKQSPTEL